MRPEKSPKETQKDLLVVCRVDARGEQANALRTARVQLAREVWGRLETFFDSSVEDRDVLDKVVNDQVGSSLIFCVKHIGPVPPTSLAPLTSKIHLA